MVLAESWDELCMAMPSTLVWDVGGQRVVDVSWSRSCSGIVTWPPAWRVVVGPWDELLLWEKVGTAWWGPLARLESCCGESASPGRAMLICLKSAMVASLKVAVVVCRKGALVASPRVCHADKSQKGWRCRAVMDGIAVAFFLHLKEPALLTQCPIEKEEVWLEEPCPSSRQCLRG